MAEYKDCATHDSCQWLRDVGSCPEHCNLYRNRDIVHVVRCKDCKHWDVDPDTYGDAFGPEGCCFGICDGANTTKQDDFCSHGERKDNA